MNKLMLGIITGLSTISVLIIGGKLIYKKGRRDQTKELKHSFEILQMGMDLGYNEKTKETE